MIKSGLWDLRLHTIYGGDRQEGDGVYLTHDQIMLKLKLLGPYVFNCQLLLNPVPEGEQQFRAEWTQRHEYVPPGLNCYILCDPANEKKKSRNHDPDYTVMWVVGIGPRGYRYLLDGVRGRLNLEERWVALRDLVKKWHPLNVGYEKYGKDSDIQHFEHRMIDENVKFNIIPLAGTLGKKDRIQRLVPIFYNKKFSVPKTGIPYVDKDENKTVNLVDALINEEMATWPYSQHDDMLDCLSRIEDRLDLGIVEPYEDESMNKMQDEVVYESFNEINEEVLF
jgi:phage terminase large subunit-like protein